jgi:prevent-host-death family protein
MLNVSATKLRNNLFEILKRVEAGEKVVITHKKKEVAFIVSAKKSDWREKVGMKPKLLVPPEQIIRPIEDIWEDYV